MLNHAMIYKACVIEKYQKIAFHGKSKASSEEVTMIK
jgi:hypothetical protein